MFARAFKSTIIASIVTFLAVAKGVPTSSGNSQCDQGEMQCCNQMMDSTDPGVSELLGLLGLDVGLGGNVGLDCTPINILGLGDGASCNMQAVCCTYVSQTGLINVGCSPINL